MDINSLKKEVVEHLNKCKVNCNSALTVYDFEGCYSFQDLICRMITKINEVVDNSNERLILLLKILEWFEDKGLIKFVKDELDNMVNDGTLSELINSDLFGAINNDLENIKNEIKEKNNGVVNKINDVNDKILPINVGLETRINVEKDDTPRLQRTINNMVEGQALCLPIGLTISNTIIIDKNIKIYSETPAEINNITYSNIKFTGEGVLFANGGKTNQIVFENLVLLGDDIHNQTGFELYVHKSNIKNCTISNFKGYAIHFVNKNFTKWTGENKIKDCFIHYCGVGVKITKDIENNSVYDSYLKDTIIHSCTRWIDADKMNGWRISGCHFYSSKPQKEPRFIIRDTAEIVIRNNYIEIGSQEDYLFHLEINNSKGGISINNNELFFSNPTTIEKAQVVFNFINNTSCKNIIVTNNMLYTNTNQPNIYLVGIEKSENSIYASILNNEFPVKQLYKSNRIDSSYELRIAHNEYHYRLNNGIVINNFNENKKLLLNSYSNYKELLSETVNQLAFLLEEKTLYAKVDKSNILLSSPLELINFSPLNSWVKKENYINQIYKKDNKVTINLTLDNGIKTNGTVILKLPENFKPKNHIEGLITLDDGKTGKFFINRINGEISVNNIDSTLSKTIRLFTSYSLN